MKFSKFIFSGLLSTAFFVSCSNNEQVDQEKPRIEQILVDDNEGSCVEVERGKSFTLKALLKDNVALGSYSLDIHHNFDGHSHSTDVIECFHEEEKEAINPFVFIKSYDLSEQGNTVQIEEVILIPEDVDAGNYHFTLKLVDKMGWSHLESFSLRIKE